MRGETERAAHKCVYYTRPRGGFEARTRVHPPAPASHGCNKERRGEAQTPGPPRQPRAGRVDDAPQASAQKCARSLRAATKKRAGSPSIQRQSAKTCQARIALTAIHPRRGCRGSSADTSIERGSTRHTSACFAALDTKHSDLLRAFRKVITCMPAPGLITIAVPRCGHKPRPQSHTPAGLRRSPLLEH